MINRLIESVCKTDSLPVVGGSVGALTQINNNSMFPPFEAIVYTIIIAAIGATVGYIVKLFLDYCMNKTDKNKTEYR